jgi:polyhydroxyalkanoate synthesis regulator phasin
MQDAWRAYLELAMGVTESSRKRAQSVARKLVGQGGATAAQLQALAEELRSTGIANREAMTKLVRFEVERALGVVGLATADEVASLNERVAELERELRGRAAAAGPSAPQPGEAEPGVSVPEPVVKKAVAKKAAPTKTTPAKKAAAEQPAPTPAKKIAAKRLPRPAKRVPAEKFPPAAGPGVQ